MGKLGKVSPAGHGPFWEEERGVDPSAGSSVKRESDLLYEKWITRKQETEREGRGKRNKEGKQRNCEKKIQREKKEKVLNEKTRKSGSGNQRKTGQSVSEGRKTERTSTREKE